MAMACCHMTASHIIVRLDELQLQKAIPAVYQSISRKSEAKASSGKHARPESDEGSSGRQKKARISFEHRAPPSTRLSTALHVGS